MVSFIVGHKIFQKSPFDLLIGSSVVAGNPDSVRDKETRSKGENISKPTYHLIDNLELVEVYKGFPVISNVTPEVAYEILYDAIEGEVKGVLVGAREEGSSTVSYFALVPKGAKSVKKYISVLIDVVDFGLIPAIQKEVEEILNADETTIREKFGNPPEKIYAGSFLGSTKDGLILIPFSTYKAKEIIPAYTGEEDERIPQLEAQLEEINLQLEKITDKEGEEYKKLLERRREILKELTKLRNKLYNPDILKAVKSKGDKVFVTQKPEIRYLGENLINAAYEYKALKGIAGDRKIKGVYAVLTLPVYNNLSGQLQRSYLEVMLSLFDGQELYAVDLQKARHTLSVMDEAVRELLKSAEAGTKPNLSTVKEKVKENLSLKKRIEDLEKFALTHSEGEDLENLIAFLREIKEELELGRRILYSPFTVSKLITNYEVISLLQDAGLDTNGLSKEQWAELFEVIETLNETLENTLKQEFKEELRLLTKLFLKKIEEGQPIKYAYKQKGQVVEGYYPAPGKPLTVIDLYPNKVLTNLIKGALRKLNATDKLARLMDVEVFFDGVTAKLGPVALTAITRKVFNLVAKAVLAKAEFNREEEVKALKNLLIANWVGDYSKMQESASTSKEEEGEIVDIEGLEDLLS